MIQISLREVEAKNILDQYLLSNYIVHNRYGVFCGHLLISESAYAIKSVIKNLCFFDKTQLLFPNMQLVFGIIFVIKPNVIIAELATQRPRPKVDGAAISAIHMVGFRLCGVKKLMVALDLSFDRGDPSVRGTSVKNTSLGLRRVAHTNLSHKIEVIVVC